MNNIMTVHDLCLWYGSHQALTDINIEIPEKSITALIGPSGCGKTTVLRLLAGLEELDEGHIILDGEDITNVPAEKRHINTVFQSYALFPHMTIFDNVAFGLRMQKVAENEIKPRVLDALRMVQLEEMADRKPAQLSGGQQQRVSIARALMNGGEIILADEPTGALDSKSTDQLLSIFDQIHQSGQTILMVTHSSKAASYASRVLFIKDGQIFHQLYKGDMSNQEMYQAISDTLTMLLSGGQ